MKQKMIILTLLISLLFLGCGGSGGSSSTSKIKVPVVNCGGPSDFTAIQTGDLLTYDTATTTVSIVTMGGTQKVCVITGSAYLLR